MSILIKGAKMPKNCWECLGNDLCVAIAEMGGACPFTERVIERNEFDAHSGMHSDCPLVEIPPHGRLIDASGMAIKFNCLDIDITTIKKLHELLMEIPTVIESEEQEYE